MYCQHCGAKLPDGAKFCTECGATTNQAPQQQQAAPQLPQQAAKAVKVKKPLFKRVWFWIVILVIFWFFRTIVATGNKITQEKTIEEANARAENAQQVADELISASTPPATSNPSTKDNPASTSKPTPSPKPTPTPKPTKASALDDGIIDVEISKCHVKYLYHEIVEDMTGNSCVAVYYQFTNNDSKAKSFVFTVGNKAFQDGIELESSLFHVNDNSHDADVDIRQGVSITVCRAYKLRNNTSDVELEVSEWISFKDTPSDIMTISIK